LRGRAQTQRPLRGFRERAVAGALIAMLLVFLLSPLLALAARSVSRLDPEAGEQGTLRPGLTLDYYQELGVNRRLSRFYAPPAAIGVSSPCHGDRRPWRSAQAARAWALARHGGVSPAGRSTRPHLPRHWR
jgi:hypothetical protein